MATRIKQDFLGNYVRMNGTRLSIYHKDSGKLFKIIDCITKKSAAEEFKRLTFGQVKHNRMRHPQARVFYAQLIIQC